MSDKKIETCLTVDPDQVTVTANCYTHIVAHQQCLLCDNTREIPVGYGHHYPWVCDECREAMVYLKEFKKTLDELRPVANNNFEEPNKNVHPL